MTSSFLFSSLRSLRSWRCIIFFLWWLTACTAPAVNQPPAGWQITLTADGQTSTVTSQATNIRTFLEEQNLTLNDKDEVIPPLFTPLSDGLTVQVVRVTESVETIDRTIPFQRKIVRNENMAESDPPRIIQPGRAGLEELTIRIVYRDGLEVERRITQTTLVEESQDEIVMIGLGVAVPDNVSFAGTIAYLSNGAPFIMRTNTAFPEAINVGAELDQRVFALAPDGSYLLYTTVPTDTENGELFNSLWVISTVRNRQPQPLGIHNVLWADWNPAGVDPLQLAYTTAEATDLPPGWEANNDLWLLELPTDPEDEFTPELLADSYPATYGWWGGHYAWSPTGEWLAYAYADEVGLLNITELQERGPVAPNDEGREELRQPLRRFTEFDTRADWVWLPSLSWSPDGRYLAFTQHAGAETTSSSFELWAMDVQSQAAGRFVGQAGLWSYPRWLPNEEMSLTYLQPLDPADSLRSSYALWLMDKDGSNGRQLYPAVGENSYFSREEQFMAWNGTGQDLVFVYNNDLYLLNLPTNQTYRLTQTEAFESHPTWSPYGAGVTTTLPTTQIEDLPEEEEREELLPEEEDGGNE